MNRVDNLTVNERGFYENAKLKLSFSLILAALGMMLLGFSSVSGGNSLSAYYLYLYYNAAGTASEFQDSQLTIRSEAGFSCFVYLSGFILCTAAALYISPLIASKKEARGLKQPQTLEELYPGERPVVTSPGIPVRNV